MMFAIAISNAFDKSHYDACEETYLKIINKYDEKERMVFPELVVDVTNVLESAPEQDFLGSVYMELELGNLLARPVFHSIQHLQMYGRAYLWKRS